MSSDTFSVSSVRMWGRFEYNLDERSRVIVPERFREHFGKEFVLTMGTDHHLRAYPMLVWNKLTEELGSSSIYDELDPNFSLLKNLFGNCEFVKMDKDFRVPIPRHLRDYARLRENEVAIMIGSGARVDIWSRSTYENSEEKFTQEKAFAAAASRKSGSGFIPAVEAGESSEEAGP